MKTETLELTKNELGIMLFALDSLFIAERREEHSKKYWETFNGLQIKIIEARERIAD